ncbi:MAG: DUF1566 domain-containing protein, partial [Thiomargarita sp.]|nr:DUF1566 domain-containing protein [Thiomargarita sp.]
MFNYLLFILLSFIWVQVAFAQDCYDNIRKTSPTTRFTVNDDATVLDKQSDLMWKRCLEGISGQNCHQGEAIELDWEQAKQQAKDSDFAGYHDWRLPSIKELAGIVELSCREPAINLEVFPNIPPSSVIWSGSPLAG